ncbi:MAG: rhodanese-like domain-containing protein, partial [Rhodocyclaceae bacterium]|nr:rhodanese-like domain-containing protein [Rhodocyclaceae bacterium]
MFDKLVDVDTLAAHLDDPAWRVFDCRFDLKNTAYGEQAYAKGHIPGALYLHLDRDLSGRPTGKNGRHPLPALDEFVARLSACGVGPDTQVVAYDNEGGIFASRLWWMLRFWLGHDKVALLDGGLAGWRRAKRPLETVPRPVAPARFVARPRHDLAVDADYVLRHLRAPDMLLI